MPNWKKQFRSAFPLLPLTTVSTTSTREQTVTLENYISTEIIEKLIEDCELFVAENMAERPIRIEDIVEVSTNARQQLRDKWL